MSFSSVKYKDLSSKGITSLLKLDSVNAFLFFVIFLVPILLKFLNTSFTCLNWLLSFNKTFILFSNSLSFNKSIAISFINGLISNEFIPKTVQIIYELIIFIEANK